MKAGCFVLVKDDPTNRVFEVLRIGQVFGTPVAWLKGYGFNGTGFVMCDNLIVASIDREPVFHSNDVQRDT